MKDLISKYTLYLFLNYVQLSYCVLVKQHSEYGVRWVFSCNAQNPQEHNIQGSVWPCLSLLTDTETPKLQKRLKMELSRTFHITHFFLSPCAIAVLSCKEVEKERIKLSSD